MTDETTQLLPLFDVLVERGRESITVQVPEHEIEVLKALHGENNIQSPKDNNDDEDEFPTNADDEILRLENKYRRINAPSPVRMVFPNGARDLVQHYGFTMGRTRQEEAPQAGIRDHKKSAKKAAKKSAK